MFVVIEGIDGSGKGTVTGLLNERLKQAGRSSTKFSFPGYDKTSCGKLVGRYLNGEFGTGIHPYLWGSLYALDRFELKPALERELAQNDFVLADRYVTSNLCYAAMQSSPDERDAVVNHFVTLEYGILRMPIPDVIIFLDMPVNFAVQNIAKKETRTYTGRAADINEADVNLLARTREFYAKELMARHPLQSRFIPVECTANNQLVAIAEVVEQVFGTITNLNPRSI